MEKLMKKLCLCILTMLMCFQVPAFNAAASTLDKEKTTDGKVIYVATDGDDSNEGTIDAPIATLMEAQKRASYGDTVYIRGGEYTDFDIARSTSSYNYVLYFDKSGITYKAYDGEKVIFNFEGDYIQGTKRVAAFYIAEKASDVTFESFEVINVPVLTLEQLKAMNSSKLLTQSECFQIRGTNITFNMISAHDNNAIGFYFQGKATGTCYRCDAYNNVGVDSASLGNMDGFGAHSRGVVFKECRAWDNSDDGFDCISSYGANVFESCWAFRYELPTNLIQDGNGFKIGGWGRSAAHAYGDVPPVHTVTNCIAAGNKASGFYSNHQPGKAADWTYNTAYNNKSNFRMTEGSEDEELDSSGKIIDAPGTREELHYNLAYKYSKKLQAAGQYGTEGNLYDSNLPGELNTNNSWNLESAVMSDADFESLDISQLAAPRNADGSLPNVTFMQPKEDSEYYGLGYSN